MMSGAASGKLMRRRMLQPRAAVDGGGLLERSGIVSK